MKKIIVKKLFSEIEEGVYPDAIIAYKKRATGFQNVDRGEGMMETVVIEYQYQLLIDLWFVILRFQWFHYPKIK